MSEIWKDIAGYEGKYQVSNLGRVKSLSRIARHWQGRVWVEQTMPERILKERKTGDMYARVALSNDGKTSDRLIHRLVAEAFIKNEHGKPEINHKNGNRVDNCVENLEWADRFDNMQHCAGVLGWHGERSANAKLRNADIVDIRSLIGWGVKSTEIAKLYGVGCTAIRSIKNGTRWARVA